jgi:hypothetical protein
MLARLLALALVLVSASCASTREVAAPAAVEPLERFEYTATLSTVPANAGKVELVVDVPESCGSAALRPTGVRGLVGNSMFELSTPGFAGSSNHGPALVWFLPHELGGERVHSVIVTTPQAEDGGQAVKGKSLEMTLGIARTAGPPLEPGALEAELARRTRALADGAPVAGLTVHLRRVN